MAAAAAPAASMLRLVGSSIFASSTKRLHSVYPSWKRHASGFTGHWSEVRRRFSMPGCGFKSRGDAEQHRFVKRTRDEIDAHGQVRFDGANQPRAATLIARAIPD